MMGSMLSRRADRSFELGILTVGADAVALRVDLLREPRADGTFGAIPSLKYAGEWVTTVALAYPAETWHWLAVRDGFTSS
jgi:hypothetical protein